MDLNMQLSDNMKKVHEYDDESFMAFARYLRYSMVPRWEEKLLFDMINERLSRQNLRMEWGCCGTNQILRRDEI